VSDRKTVYDAVVAALLDSTGVSYVTRDAETWTNWGSNKFPGVYLNDDSEEHSWLAYPSTDTDDMEAAIELTAHSAVFDWDGSAEVDEVRAQLISDITSTVMSSTAVDDVTADVLVSSVETDAYTAERYGVCAVRFRARYFYNHASP